MTLLRTSRSMSTAVATPDSRATQPAVPVIFFQNRPKMKIANSGALKKLANAWM